MIPRPRRPAPYSTQQGPEDPPRRKRPIVISEFAVHADQNPVTAENWGQTTDPGWDECWPLKPGEVCGACGGSGPCNWRYPEVPSDAARASAYSTSVDGLLGLVGNGSPILPPEGRAHFVAGYFWYGMYDHPLASVFDLEDFPLGSTQGPTQQSPEAGPTQNWGLPTAAPALEMTTGFLPRGRT